MDIKLRELFSERAEMKKKIRFISREMYSQLRGKECYKFKQLIKANNNAMYDYIEDNFDHKYLVMMKKYQERIKCIDQEINPDIKDVETMMYVECMSFDEELRAYFQDKNIPYQSSLDDTCMHIQIDGRGYNTQLIYDEHLYTDYVNLYKIIYEYSWLRKYEDLIDHLLDKVEDLRENEYTIKRT